MKAFKFLYMVFVITCAASVGYAIGSHDAPQRDWQTPLEREARQVANDVYVVCNTVKGYAWYECERMAVETEERILAGE